MKKFRGYKAPTHDNLHDAYEHSLKWRIQINAYARHTTKARAILYYP